MDTISHVILVNDIRLAYEKLHKLINDANPTNSKWKQIKELANCIHKFYDNNVKAYDEEKIKLIDLQEHAEKALEEGHVELFEKLADWCNPFSFKECDLVAWQNCLDFLYYSINFYCCYSIQLANRLAKSKQYIKMGEIQMRSNLNDNKTMLVLLANTLSHLNMGIDSIRSFRELYPLILDIYKNNKSEEIQVAALVLLSQLATENEAKDFLHVPALSLLVGYLGKSVRTELDKDKSTWAATRRMNVIRTLEKMITSDEHIVATLLDLQILENLTLAFNSPVDSLGNNERKIKLRKTEELRATLKCLLTISLNQDALQSISLNESLVKEIENRKTQPDKDQADPANNILKILKKINVQDPTNAKSINISNADGLYSSYDAIAPGGSAEQSIKNESEAPVFISYQSKFAQSVLMIKQTMEARDIPCWLASENLVGEVQDEIAKALMVAPAIILCISRSYRESVYCKEEANYALRLNIPMVVCCMEEGYVADYWLGLITAAPRGLDCSTNEKLHANMDQLQKELLKAKKKGIPKEKTTLKPSFADWDVNRTAEWLKSLSRYEQIPKKYRRMINGAFLKELRNMRQISPNDFSTSLKKIFHLNAATIVKFRIELDKLV